MRLDFQSLAIIDPKKIAEYSGQHNPVAANKLVGGIEACRAGLTENPLMDRSRQELMEFEALRIRAIPSFTKWDKTP